MQYRDSETGRQVKLKQAELSVPGNPCDEFTALEHVIDDRFNTLLAGLKAVQSRMHALETKGHSE